MGARGWANALQAFQSAYGQSYQRAESENRLEEEKRFQIENREDLQRAAKEAQLADQLHQLKIQGKEFQQQDKTLRTQQLHNYTTLGLQSTYRMGEIEKEGEIDRRNYYFKQGANLLYQPLIARAMIDPTVQLQKELLREVETPRMEMETAQKKDIMKYGDTLEQGWAGAMGAAAGAFARGDVAGAAEIMRQDPRAARFMVPIISQGIGDQSILGEALAIGSESFDPRIKTRNENMYIGADPNATPARMRYLRNQRLGMYDQPKTFMEEVMPLVGGVLDYTLQGYSANPAGYGYDPTSYRYETRQPRFRR